jgi:hypothetical protein
MRVEKDREEEEEEGHRKGKETGRGSDKIVSERIRIIVTEECIGASYHGKDGNHSDD